MGDVGIVARVLDDAGAGRAGSRRLSASAKATARRAAASPRPDREIRRSAAPQRPPWRPRWRRRRWSSRGAAGDPVWSARLSWTLRIVRARRERHDRGSTVSGRGLIVAAPRSGAGKTTVTLALLAALRRRGIAVQAAKAGPDYIDPGFHAAATGAAGCQSRQLGDAAGAARRPGGARPRAAPRFSSSKASWACSTACAGSARPRAARPPILRRASACRCVLVLDVAGQSQSAAAVVRGFASHDPAVRIAGVMLNRVGSERHRALGRRSRIAALGIPVLRRRPARRRAGAAGAPSRPGAGRRASRSRGAASIASPTWRNAISISMPSWPRAAPLGDCGRGAAPPPRCRRPASASRSRAIAAFSFVYPHVLDGWRRAGAEIVAFSPLADEPPPERAMPAGCPAAIRSCTPARSPRARRFRDGTAAVRATRPVHGECGGYMVLGESLDDADGSRHAMTGLLGHATSFAQRKLHLGYREARLLADSALGRRRHDRARPRIPLRVADLGRRRRAARRSVPTAKAGRSGQAGGRRGHVTGTFFHAIAAAMA